MRGEDASHEEEGVSLAAGRRRRRRQTRKLHELGEVVPPAELDVPEDAARHASRDRPRHPSSLSPDSSRSDSDCEPTAYASPAVARCPRETTATRPQSALVRSTPRPIKKIQAEMRLGFDVVASELQKTLDEQVRDISTSKSVQVAQLHLKTAFQSSAKGVSTPQPVCRSSRIQQCGVSGNLAPITPPSCANPDAAASRLDQVYAERSSQNQGMRF